MIIKKYLKKAIKVTFYLFSPIIILSILITQPFIKIRLSYQSSERLGDFATHMEVYLSEKKIYNSKNYFDIFILTNIISNETFTNLLKKKVRIIPDYIAYPVFHIIQKLGGRFKFFQNFILNTKFDDNNFSIMRTPCNLIPDENFIKKGNDFLKSINVPNDAQIICLIVRENAYLKKKFPNKNWDYHEYRNCNIENYKMAINAATERGYYVFRMGQYVEKKVKIDGNDKFIDYSSNFRSDFLDIYLAYRCKFCITTSTGWDCVPAFTFRKPILYTNYTPVGNLLTYSPNFLFSIKTHYDYKNQKKLSLKEISQSPFAFANNTKLFKESNIELIENSPEDLKDLTIEMIEKLDGNMKISEEDERLQKIFWKQYVEYFNLKNIKPEISIKVNPLWCSSKRLYNNKIISRFGNQFLKKNLFLVE